MSPSMPRVFVQNFSNLREAIDLEERPKANDVVDQLQQHICQNGLPDKRQVNIPITYNPYRTEGYAVFEYVGVIEGFYFFRFLTTIL